MKDKHWWLDLAEVIDGLRIVPRLFLFIILACCIALTWWMLSWYFALPSTARGIEVSGFAALVYTTTLGFLKLVYGDYKDGARDWSQRYATATVVNPSPGAPVANINVNTGTPTT